MSGASVRTGTRIPRNLLATIGHQVLRMLSGDHLGVHFPGARQIRSLAERTRSVTRSCSAVCNTAVFRVRDALDSLVT